MTTRKRGDVTGAIYNGDRTVLETGDASAILNHIVGNNVLTDINDLKAANVDENLTQSGEENIETGDASIILNVIVGNASFDDLGTFTVIGNEPEDETPPVISLNGGNVTIPVGGTYNELGASATDNVDSTVTVDIDNSQVNTSSPGEYTVTYTATDAAGNQSQKTITVTVEGPTFQSLTNSTIQTAVNDWIAGGTAKDNVISTYGSIENWNTSNVTSMSSLFKDANTFNDDIGSWDVSNVTSMMNMFNKATVFNQDITSWDVSKVSGFYDMYGMFFEARAFNQAIGSWDVSNVTFMWNMFYGATSFNSDLSGWNVSNVMYMSNMFTDATAFNQDISSWDVSNVRSMYSMFDGATAFNQDITSWDVTSVSTMKYMFRGATAFNQDIGSWDVSNVDDMNSMFDNALVFNQDIGSWNVSKVDDMYGMFSEAAAFNQPIGSWNVSNVTTMQRMFYLATAFNKPIGSWNVTSVSTMRYMFYGATAFNQDISSWDVSNVTSSMESMFENAVNFNQDITSWVTAAPSWAMKNMFKNADAMQATYSTTPGFGNTPTADFFNKEPSSNLIKRSTIYSLSDWGTLYSSNETPDRWTIFMVHDGIIDNGLSSENVGDWLGLFVGDSLRGKSQVIRIGNAYGWQLDIQRAGGVEKITRALYLEVLEGSGETAKGNQYEIDIDANDGAFPDLSENGGANQPMMFTYFPFFV